MSVFFFPSSPLPLFLFSSVVQLFLFSFLRPTRHSPLFDVPAAGPQANARRSYPLSFFSLSFFWAPNSEEPQIPVFFLYPLPSRLPPGALLLSVFNICRIPDSPLSPVAFGVFFFVWFLFLAFPEAPQLGLLLFFVCHLGAFSPPRRVPPFRCCIFVYFPPRRFLCRSSLALSFVTRRKCCVLFFLFGRFFSVFE